MEFHHRPERDPVRLDSCQPDRRDEGVGPLPVHSSQSRAFVSGGLRRQNLQQDIDRKAAENDYRINVKAELKIELLHEKIDQLREREVLKLTEAVRTLTELLEPSASGARESDAEGGRPS